MPRTLGQRIKFWWWKTWRFTLVIYVIAVLLLWGATVYHKDTVTTYRMDVRQYSMPVANQSERKLR